MNKIWEAAQPDWVVFLNKPLELPSWAYLKTTEVNQKPLTGGTGWDIYCPFSGLELILSNRHINTGLGCIVFIIVLTLQQRSLLRDV